TRGPIISQWSICRKQWSHISPCITGRNTHHIFCSQLFRSRQPGSNTGSAVADAMTLHADSIVIDAVCPLVMKEPGYLAWYREGGVTALAPTMGGWENARTTLTRIAAWRRILREREDLLLVSRARDIEIAKERNRLGVYLHLQGTDPIEDNLDL